MCGSAILAMLLRRRASGTYVLGAFFFADEISVAGVSGAASAG
jgi:hypothetical protein